MTTRRSDLAPVAAVSVHGLDFSYPGSPTPVLRQLELVVPAGVRCLLVGRNGVGKTTLLRLIAGYHMVADQAVRVLGQPAFSDTSLSGRVSFIGGNFPLDVDVSVDEILARRSAIDPARREHLLEILGVERSWRMGRVSDGQRRRVQLLLGLLAPYELLLLDEVTTDLDVIARADLLAFLRRESAERGAAVLYATHVLDGMEAWATHLAYLEDGIIRLMQPLTDIAELVELQARGAHSPLLRMVERWLRRRDVSARLPGP